MTLSKEIRRLAAKWDSGQGWPKRLQWLEIKGIRGWAGHHLDFDFPIVAIIGENGVGKSTVLQSAASVYDSPSARGGKKGFASYFFPSTTWDTIANAEIAYGVREGETTITKTIRKPTGRWRGNPDRRERDVTYVDLSRIQPVAERVGYQRLANPLLKEATTSPFETGRVGRLSQIMGRVYDDARMALTNFDPKRPVPVVSHLGVRYSGFHSGAGETTVTELLQVDPPPYGIVLIDEIESSLHPRSQRRLIRDLAQLCYQRELQIILTTHSPYILEELPLPARVYIMLGKTGCRSIITGVSPDFAMTQMDDEAHPECDLYVEDDRAGAMLIEILVVGSRGVVPRCRTIAFGAASVGRALGEMVANNRFPRPSCVFLDGDQTATSGCHLLPGGDAPERVVFEGLAAKGWGGIAARVGRGHAEVADACAGALPLGDEHQWVNFAATKLTLAGATLWQALCAEWTALCLPDDERKRVTQIVEDVLLPLGSLPPPHPSGLPRDQLSLLN